MENKPSIKVILSTFGPLHLMKSAEYLSKYADIKIIQGWVPKPNSLFVKIIGKIINKDLTISFKKRYPQNIKYNYGIGMPEFLLWIGKKIKIFNNIFSSVNSAKLYSFLSKKYIKNADIFHVRSGNGGVAIDIARKRGLKIIVDQSIAHNNYIEKALKPEYDRYNLYWGFGPTAPFWKYVLEDCEKADIILVNSEFVKKTFIEAGYKKEKIKVSYLGVRKDFWGLKTNYEIQGKIKILFTGGFGFRKGGLYILQALQELDRMNLNYEFTVVGSYDESHILNKYLPKNIHFVGFIPQEKLKAYFINYDIYLFPSLVEGCASSGMEAMAAGMPVIATEASGLPIIDKQNGILIQPQNVISIVEAILLLKNNDKLREKIGKNAYELIKHNYSWENYAQNVYTIYKEIIEK